MQDSSLFLPVSRRNGASSDSSIKGKVGKLGALKTGMVLRLVHLDSFFRASLGSHFLKKNYFYFFKFF